MRIIRTYIDDRDEYEWMKVSAQGWFARLSLGANPGNLIAEGTVNDGLGKRGSTS